MSVRLKLKISITAKPIVLYSSEDIASGIIQGALL